MAASWADVFTLVDRIRKEYPQYAYLLDHKEIGPLLLKAASGDYDTQTLAQKIYATKWWNTTAESKRNWDAFASTDPASAKAKVKQMRGRIGDLAGQLGARVTGQGQHWIAVSALAYGWDDNQLTDAIVDQIKYQDFGTGGEGTGWQMNRVPSGQAGATIDQIRALAGQYGLKIGDSSVWAKMRAVLKGEVDMDGIESTFRQQAIGRFAHLKDVIESGVTPAAFFEPYKAIIGDQLEVNPESVDIFNDPKWTEVISHADPETGQVRAMTLSEATRHVRSTQEWKGTQRAGQEASEMAETLARAFGAVAT